jgi:hypothetical protein
MPFSYSVRFGRLRPGLRLMPSAPSSDVQIVNPPLEEVGHPARYYPIRKSNVIKHWPEAAFGGNAAGSGAAEVPAVPK